MFLFFCFYSLVYLGDIHWEENHKMEECTIHRCVHFSAIRGGVGGGGRCPHELALLLFFFFFFFFGGGGGVLSAKRLILIYVWIYPNFVWKLIITLLWPWRKSIHHSPPPPPPPHTPTHHGVRCQINNLLQPSKALIHWEYCQLTLLWKICANSLKTSKIRSEI